MRYVMRLNNRLDTAINDRSSRSINNGHVTHLSIHLSLSLGLFSVH